MTRKKKKKLDWKFNRINTSIENYGVDYELGRIQTFISKFKKDRIRIKRETKRNKSLFAKY